MTDRQLPRDTDRDRKGERKRKRQLTSNFNLPKEIGKKELGYLRERER